MTITLVIGDELTYSSLIHEVFHLEHWKRDPRLFDPTVISPLAGLAKEREVLERVLQDHIWKSLTVDERTQQIRTFVGALGRARGKLPPEQDAEIIRTLVNPAWAKLGGVPAVLPSAVFPGFSIGEIR